MGSRYVPPKTKRKDRPGKFHVLVYCQDAGVVERRLDGGVGGLKDRRAAARVAFYWLLDNGYTKGSRPLATQLAAKLEDGGSVVVKTQGRNLRLSIEQEGS